MKEIPLTQKKAALVDDDDYEVLAHHNWYAAKDHGGNWYAQRARPGAPGCVIFMHREILQAPNGVFVDHRDGNSLNNTRRNIRLCNKSQNGGNAKLPKHNTSGFKGVHVNNRPDKPWKAVICYQGKRIYMGMFSDPADAARVYDAKAKELFGEFARLNFPQH